MKTKPTTIGARLAIGYGALLLLIIALSALAVLRVGQIGSLLDSVEGTARAKQRHAMELRGSVRERATVLRDVVLAPDAAAAAGPVSRIKTHNDNYARAASTLDALVQDLADLQPEEKKALAAIKEQERRTRPLLDRVIALQAEGHGQEAATLLNQQAGPAFADWMASLTRFIELEDKLAGDGMGAARDLASSFPGWMAALCLAALAATLPGAWFIARGLGRAAPLPAAEPAAAPVTPVPSRSADEIVGAIDGIAFQANILALDAAVEAVRSGAFDDGAAQEVRALAGRADAVAGEIRRLLASPAAQREEAAALGAIADAAARVTAVMSVIVPGAELLETARRETALLRAASAATALEQGARRLAHAIEAPGVSLQG
ncbi:methyl-accepting chemotaxis protein [uncultured Massilia sp.]|uniref:methyl-accepting chemotaxis protein n=1 Tax=uncultured Massilia sp. TaxID=169973 RepID=UPI0025859992|nr:MCP four helix bundle domain-containing protein [uncultured Massilia sp.]